MYLPNIYGVDGEVVHPSPFKVVIHVVVRNKQELFDGVSLLTVQLDKHSGVRAGAADISCLNLKVITDT